MDQSDPTMLSTLPPQYPGGATTGTNPSATFLELDPEHQQLAQKIELCSAVLDFVHIYDSFTYQSCLSRLRTAIGNAGVEGWVNDWAIRMLHRCSQHQQQLAASDDDENDMLLDQDRRVVLQLVYALCDRCWQSSSSSSKALADELLAVPNVDHNADDLVTEFTIKTVFKTRRLVNILQLVLPMERARVLNQMERPWVSRQHMGATQSLRVEAGGFCPTIDQRLVLLMESPVLGLSDVGIFRRWMEPRLRGDSTASNPMSGSS